MALYSQPSRRFASTREHEGHINPRARFGARLFERQKTYMRSAALSHYGSWIQADKVSATSLTLASSKIVTLVHTNLHHSKHTHTQQIEQAAAYMAFQVHDDIVAMLRNNQETHTGHEYLQ